MNFDFLVVQIWNIFQVHPLVFMCQILILNLRNGSTDRGKQSYKSKYRCFTPWPNGECLCSGPFFALNLISRFVIICELRKGWLRAFQRVEGCWRFHFCQSNRKDWKICLLDWKCYKQQEVNCSRWMWDLWSTRILCNTKIQPNSESSKTASGIWVLIRKLLTNFAIYYVTFW